MLVGNILLFFVLIILLVLFVFLFWGDAAMDQPPFNCYCCFFPFNYANDFFLVIWAPTQNTVLVVHRRVPKGSICAMCAIFTLTAYVLIFLHAVGWKMLFFGRGFFLFLIKWPGSCQMLVPRRLGGGLRAVRRRGAALTIAGGGMCHRWRRAALRCWGSVPWHCAGCKSAALRFLCFCARVLFFVFIISGRWCGWLFRWNAARPNLGPAVGCEVAFSLCTRVVWSEFVGFFFGFYFLFTFFGRKCLVSYLKFCVWPLAQYMWVLVCQSEGV